MRAPSSLSDRIALITGAGAGIGREIALRFAQEGAQVAVADIDLGAAQRVSAEIEAGGHKSLAIGADVGDPTAAERMASSTVEHFGRLDILVNNAGIGLTKSFLGTTIEEWDQVLRINLTGTFLCAQAAARVMTRQGSGTIVNVASISGERGGAGRAAYGASKAGVILLTKVMAVELAPKGIRVNAISPGPTETEQVRQCHDQATRDAYCAMLPIHRYAAPSEIAAAALFLASPDASFVSGHILNVDGGFGAAGLMFDLE